MVQVMLSMPKYSADEIDDITIIGDAHSPTRRCQYSEHRRVDPEKSTSTQNDFRERNASFVVIREDDISRYVLHCDPGRRVAMEEISAGEHKRVAYDSF